LADTTARQPQPGGTVSVLSLRVSCIPCNAPLTRLGHKAENPLASGEWVLKAFDYLCFTSPTRQNIAWMCLYLCWLWLWRRYSERGASSRNYIPGSCRCQACLTQLYREIGREYTSLKE